VIYSEDFYNRFFTVTNARYCKLGWFKDVLVGAISTKTDTEEDGSKTCYIMTITVLKPYRRYQVGVQLLNEACKNAIKENVFKMQLHV
jgi:ribosomal protein S18 acetylase RimI-like enzyme